MSPIDNDLDLRRALETLSAEQQRLLGARFAQRVIHLCRDERVRRAIEIGLRAEATPSEVEDAFKAAKAYAVKTYTDCGKDTDWLAQADHFVAAAIAAALTPTAQMSDKRNTAWKAAMQARMAVNCAMIENDEASTTSEAEQQYALANALLG